MHLTAYTAEAILCLVSAILCLVTGTLLLIFSARNKAKIFLGLSYLTFGVGMVVIALIFSRLILHVPFLYRTGNIFLLLYMPLSWLYTQYSVVNKHFSAWQLIHFLPALIFIVDYVPFFLSSSENKTAVIGADLDNLNQMLRFRQGWLLPGKYVIPARTLQMTIYWLFQVRLLASRNMTARRNDPQWVRWQYIYNGLQLPIFLPALIVLLSGGHFYIWATSIPPAATSLLSAFTLLMMPQVLYSINSQHTAHSGVKPRANFDAAFIQQFNLHLEKIMQGKKPFLNPDYTLGELADTMGMPAHKLSAYINQVTGKNFSDYLNYWRIIYCLELIREKKIGNLNLRGISTQCGFNNRNTFSSAFKKVTGMTPSSYLHSNI